MLTFVCDCNAWLHSSCCSSDCSIDEHSLRPLQWDSSFSQTWSEGAVPGWRGENQDGVSEGRAEQTAVNLQDIDTVEELLDPELVPPEKMKEVTVSCAACSI